jgi:hypothetical protein
MKFSSLPFLLAAAILPVCAALEVNAASELEELKTKAAEMEKAFEELKGRIQRIESQQGGAPATNPPPATVAPAAPSAAPAIAAAKTPPADDLADHGSARIHRDTLSEDNVASPRPGNAPIDPTYEGYMQLFGTKTWIKLGGYAKLDVIMDSTKTGNPNKLVTSAIPVPGEANFGTDSDFNIHAKQTRIGFDLRSPTQIGALRIVYENDFFGSATTQDMTYNLRHFYAQIANVTAGQTWSAFFDPDAIPDSLDFEGPGMQTIVRQPQLRYTYSPVKEHMHLAVAIEQPKSDVVALPAGTTTRNVMPDFTAHWRLEGATGHVQVGGLLRALAYDNPAGADDCALGWGVNISGLLHIWERDGLIGRVTVGDGIGRYMQDLGTGNGAVVDAAGNVQTLAAWGAMIGYRHYWGRQWHSQVSYGYMELDNRAELGALAYDHTHYAQGNLIWSATPAFFIGIEYLYGMRAVRSGVDGDDHRVQLSLQYKLIR